MDRKAMVKRRDELVCSAVKKLMFQGGPADVEGRLTHRNRDAPNYVVVLHDSIRMLTEATDIQCMLIGRKSGGKHRAAYDAYEFVMRSVKGETAEVKTQEKIEEEQEAYVKLIDETIETVFMLKEDRMAWRPVVSYAFLDLVENMWQFLWRNSDDINFDVIKAFYDGSSDSTVKSFLRFVRVYDCVPRTWWAQLVKLNDKATWMFDYAAQGHLDRMGKINAEELEACDETPLSMYLAELSEDWRSWHDDSKYGLRQKLRALLDVTEKD